MVRASPGIAIADRVLIIPVRHRKSINTTVTTIRFDLDRSSIIKYNKGR